MAGAQVALAEADHILGGSGIATRCYLSFALLPDGYPMPPSALEELWRLDEETGGVSGRGARSFAPGHDESTAVEVLEALRLLGRAGGGEGAAGLAPHGIQRRLILAMAPDHSHVMAKLLRRRVAILSKISCLVGTYDDGCWALGGAGEDQKSGDAGSKPGTGTGARTGSRGRGGRGGSGGRGGTRRERWLRRRDEEEPQADRIPTGLLGSGPGPPTHGYGGFSRYDALVASWEALPPSFSLASAASGYLESVRAACKAAQGAGSGGGWAAARALASAADFEALADRGSDAIPAYEEACALLAKEAARNSQARGISRWQRSARDTLHKVANMVQDLALLMAYLRKEAPAIRLLQRAVEIHLSVLGASGALVPDLGGGRAATAGDGIGHLGASSALTGSADSEVEEAAQLLEAEKGRGAGITWKAVANDDRSLRLRLRLQPVLEAGEPVPAGRAGGGGGAAAAAAAAANGGGGGGTLPPFGRLDVVATCIGDLGLVVSCTRQLRQAKRIDESVQLAAKVYPILREILGAEHPFTKAAQTGFVGQGTVDESWSQKGPAPGGASGGSAVAAMTGIHALSDALGPGQHPSLPSPTSRRRLARNYEGRGPGGAAASGDNKKAAGAAVPSAVSALSSPPSPLPREFYSRPSIVAPAAPRASAQMFETPTASSSAAIGEIGGGDATAAAAAAAGRGGAEWGSYLAGGSGGRGEFVSGRYSFGGGSSSSGSDLDEGDDSDGAPRGVGALGAPGRGPRASRASHGGGGSATKRALDRHLQPWQRESQASWQQVQGVVSSAGERGALHPASTLMQHDRYIRHLIRRARAHAFLVTAATRARLKDADRAKAGLFLRDRAREAGAAAMDVASPEGGGPQMPRLIARRR